MSGSPVNQLRKNPRKNTASQAPNIPNGNRTSMIRIEYIPQVAPYMLGIKKLQNHVNTPNRGFPTSREAGS
jgi:hypothetical protein